jgi:Flp pilus assembly protein TadD
MNQITTKSGQIDRWLLCGLVWLLAGCSIGDRPDPNSGIAGMNVADAALDGGMPQTALNVTSSILESQPHNVIALLRQGDALAQLNQPDAAMESYRRALAVAPATAAALLGLGRLELSRGDAADAEHHFAKLLTITPNDGVAMNNLGVAAQAEYAKLLRIQPGNRSASVNQALSLSLSGQADRSVALLRGPATRPDATPRMRQDLAVALTLSGNTREATQVLLTDLSPSDAAAALAGYQALDAAEK